MMSIDLITMRCCFQFALMAVTVVPIPLIVLPVCQDMERRVPVVVVSRNYFLIVNAKLSIFKQLLFQVNKLIGQYVSMKEPIKFISS